MVASRLRNKLSALTRAWWNWRTGPKLSGERGLSVPAARLAGPAGRRAVGPAAGPGSLPPARGLGAWGAAPSPAAAVLQSGEARYHIDFRVSICVAVWFATAASTLYIVFVLFVTDGIMASLKYVGCS